jgi:hypothetical protein
MARKYQGKIGRRIREDGYIDIWAPTHPIARRDGYVFEHRKIAWDNELLTDPTYEVHHKNLNRQDNRLDNFEIKTGTDHTREHQEERGVVTNQFGTFQVKPRDERQSAKWPSVGYIRPERTCAKCGNSIPSTKRADSRFCSDNCRVRSWKHSKRG